MAIHGQGGAIRPDEPLPDIVGWRKDADRFMTLLDVNLGSMQLRPGFAMSMLVARYLLKMIRDIVEKAPIPPRAFDISEMKKL